MSNTISMSTELDVVSKFEQLMRASLGGEGVYIRAKETLQDLADNGLIKEADKAKVLADIMTSINTAVVNASMGTALQWATTEKDLLLKKLEAQKQLTILDKDIALKEAQKVKVVKETIATESSNIRANGTPTVDGNGNVTSLATDGKMYWDVQLTKQQIENEKEQEKVLQGKTRESNAVVHKVIADTYWNYGSFVYTVGDGGVTSVHSTDGTHETLAGIQKIIAKQQANGYAYNAWANAVTSASSAVGTRLAGGGTVDAEYQTLITTVQAGLNKLNSAKVGYLEYTT